MQDYDLFIHPRMKRHKSPARWSSPSREILNANCYSHQSPRLSCTQWSVFWRWQRRYWSSPSLHHGPFQTRLGWIRSVMLMEPELQKQQQQRDKNQCHGSGIHMGETGWNKPTLPIAAVFVLPQKHGNESFPASSQLRFSVCALGLNDMRDHSALNVCFSSYASSSLTRVLSLLICS